MSDKIPAEVKEQILKRVKEGVPVAQCAREHEVSTKTIYNWLSRGTENAASWPKYRKLKKERDDLLKIIGELTHQMSKREKNKARA